MDTFSIDSFSSQSLRAASWCPSRTGAEHHYRTFTEPSPSLDLDALQVALTQLDHSIQKGKAFVGRSGALKNRRPPSRCSRSSRHSSVDSVHFFQDQFSLAEEKTLPKVVNIEVQLEGDDAKSDSVLKENKNFALESKNIIERTFNVKEKLLEPKIYKSKTREYKNTKENLTANQEIRRRLSELRYKKLGGSNPLLSFANNDEEIFRRIKQEVTHLASKRRSTSDINASLLTSNIKTFDLNQDNQRSDTSNHLQEDTDSILESASVVLTKDTDDNRSSSEAEFVISDRESIADSGLVNRRTVIKINEKKSKSATNLIPDSSVPLWKRDLETRRSLRSDKENSRVIPIQIHPEFEGGINVSIHNQSETSPKDSTSRMFVRQCDSENRPSRASAFNVRQTIEKRQIQQERRERRALRERIREQLRSLSEGRERKDSSGSHGSSSHLSQNSERSKSMSSLDQDQDDFRSESPLFKVQSSPTLEKEKEDVRQYLYGVSNLTESEASSLNETPSYKEEVHNIKQDYLDPFDVNNSAQQEQIKSFTSPNENCLYNSLNSLKSEVLETHNKKYNNISLSADIIYSPSQRNLTSASETSTVSQIPKKHPRGKYIFHHIQPEKTKDSVNSYIVNDFEDTNHSINSQSKNSVDTNSGVSYTEQNPPDFKPIPPPRRRRISLSTGYITLEGEEKPDWIRLAKERRSLRTAKQVDQLSDRASTAASKEPEWVAKARKKLEALNVTLTSTTDFNSVSSHVTESSSAWSRGGLDALDDLREEASRIGEELAEEVNARVNEDLGLKNNHNKMIEHNINHNQNKMIEHNINHNRESSTERPRVSFEASAIDASDGDSNRKYPPKKTHKDEVRFGDLKHDWGGVQSKATKSSSGKIKEMRFGEIQTRETLPEPPLERNKETRFGDNMNSLSESKIHIKEICNELPPERHKETRSTNNANTSNENQPVSPNGDLPVMRFGDTPLNLFPASQPKVQSSSKFESIAGPDPFKMTAEQLNQNVEEYDFPVPTGNEDATELMKFLEESIKRAEAVPEVVTADDNKPKPKSILKRRSVENVIHELKKEEKSENLQKVDHRKSASFDWDIVDKQATTSSSSTTEPTNPTATTTKAAFIQSMFSSHQSSRITPSITENRDEEENDRNQRPAKVFSFTFSPEQNISPETTFTNLEGESLIKHEHEKESKMKEVKTFTVITNPSDINTHSSHKQPKLNVSYRDIPPSDSLSSQFTTELPKTVNKDSEDINTNLLTKTPPFPIRSSWKKLNQNSPSSSTERERRKSSDVIVNSSSISERERKKSSEIISPSNSSERDRKKSSEIKISLSNSSERERKKSSDIIISTTSSSERERKRSSDVIINPSSSCERERKKSLDMIISPSSSSERERRKVSDIIKNININQNVNNIKVEIIDKGLDKDSLQQKDEEKRRNSLLEWEALQRQRLEEEERNRINKNLSMKPVSSKIKELVKLHGSFMSMFSKDKKTDIKGTVDGKEDILFHKISHDNLSFDATDQPLKETAPTMKSPYMVKKLMNPLESTDVTEEPKLHKSDLKHLSKNPYSGHRSHSHSRLVKDRSLSPSKISSVRDRSLSPSKISSVRDRSVSPSKISSVRDRSLSPTKRILTRERSPSPIKNQFGRDRSQSPLKLQNRRERSPSPAKSYMKDRNQSPTKLYTRRGRSPSPSSNYHGRSRTHSPTKHRSRRDRSPSPAKSQSPNKSHLRLGRSSSREKLHALEDKIKAMEKKEKYFQKVLADETNDSFVKDDIPLSLKIIKRSRSPSKTNKLSTSNSYFNENDMLMSSTKSPESKESLNSSTNNFIVTNKTNPPIPPKPSHLSDSNMAAKLSPPIPPKPANLLDNSTLTVKASPPIPPKPHHLREKALHFENTTENTTKETNIMFRSDIKERKSIRDPKARKEWLDKMLETISSDYSSGTEKSDVTDSKTFHSPHQNEQTPLLNSSDKNKNYLNESTVQVPNLLLSKSNLEKNKETSSLRNSCKTKLKDAAPNKAASKSHKTFSSLPSPNKNESSQQEEQASLRYSIKEALSSTTSSTKRGPVSLSSILGDSSSVSSSLTSTPITSPRATPERVIRKDSLDILSKLDIIPETRTREPVHINSLEEHKENIDPSPRTVDSVVNGEIRESLVSSSPLFSYKSKFSSEELGEPKDEGITAKHDNEKPRILSPGSSGRKQLLTMKTMISGVDRDRVSTSKIPKHNSTSIYAQSYLYDDDDDDDDDDETSLNEKEAYSSNSYPRDNRDNKVSRFSKERTSLREKPILEKTQRQSSENNIKQNRFREKVSSHVIKEGEVTQSPNDMSPRPSIDTEKGSVSLASILSRNNESKYSRSDEPTDFQFKPDISFSKETNSINIKYCQSIANKYSPVDLRDTPSVDALSYNNNNNNNNNNSNVNDDFDKDSLDSSGEHSKASSSIDQASKENSPSRDIPKVPNKYRRSGDTASRKGRSNPSKSSSKSSGKQRSLVVRRNSSLKRNYPKDKNTAPDAVYKRERRDSKDSGRSDVKSETVIKNNKEGWTKTKTTVRRARLGSNEKTKQIVRTNSGKTKKDKTFKLDASKNLEVWAAGTQVQGKLVKKEGQRFSNETEEEVQGGQRTSRVISRRVIRRGSRRLSGGGELLTETKEMTTEPGRSKEREGSDASDEEISPQRPEVLAIDDGISRKMKTSTDGERYMTQSVSTKGGKEIVTTEGVNNKTTNSVELIGGDDFEAKREVLGKTGHRVVVERSKDNLGRPSTVVKKITSQSRVVITKTKRKNPLEV